MWRAEIGETADQMTSPYTAVIYRVTLVRVPDDEPLKGCSYFGQAVRIGAFEKVARKRWHEEVREAKTSTKRFGFLPMLKKYGPDAFDWDVLKHVCLRYAEAQSWADDQEIAAIEDAGGPLRDAEKQLKQTLNREFGGKGSLKGVPMDAYSAATFRVFQKAMLAYIAEHNDANVPADYVCADGYKLGRQLSNVRSNGLYLTGSQEDARRAWFSSLPGFVWNFGGSEEYRRRIGECTKTRFKDPLYKEARVKALQEARDAAIRKRRREYVVKVVRSALPYERVRKKRVVGSFYHQLDGTIARCTTQLKWSFGGKRVNAEEIRSVGEV